MSAARSTASVSRSSAVSSSPVTTARLACPFSAVASVKGLPSARATAARLEQRRSASPRRPRPAAAAGPRRPARVQSPSRRRQRREPPRLGELRRRTAVAGRHLADTRNDQRLDEQGRVLGRPGRLDRRRRGSSHSGDVAGGVAQPGHRQVQGRAPGGVQLLRLDLPRPAQPLDRVPAQGPVQPGVRTRRAARPGATSTSRASVAPRLPCSVRSRSSHSRCSGPRSPVACRRGQLQRRRPPRRRRRPRPHPPPPGAPTRTAAPAPAAGSGRDRVPRRAPPATTASDCSTSPPSAPRTSAPKTSSAAARSNPPANTESRRSSDLLVGGEQVVAPVEGRADRPLPFGQVAGARRADRASRAGPAAAAAAGSGRARRPARAPAGARRAGGRSRRRPARSAR